MGSLPRVIVICNISAMLGYGMVPFRRLCVRTYKIFCLKPETPNGAWKAPFYEVREYRGDDRFHAWAWDVELSDGNRWAFRCTEDEADNIYFEADPTQENQILAGMTRVLLEMGDLQKERVRVEFGLNFEDIRREG